MMERVWFITGASRGLGRVWTEAALDRGDSVAAAARSVTDLDDLVREYGGKLLATSLDVTDAEQVNRVVHQAHNHFGRLDVVVNNAGYPLMGAIEEAALDDIRALYETNVLGTVSVLQATLPLLRAQRSGHILGISSTLGHVVMPTIGFYCSSKWAFEAIHESLAAEVQEFGIHVTIVEPGAYATGFGGPASGHFAPPLEVYAGVKERVLEGIKTMERGRPKATARAILQLVDSDQPPLRLFLGKHNLPQVRQTYMERLATWEAWSSVADSAQ